MCGPRYFSRFVWSLPELERHESRFWEACVVVKTSTRNPESPAPPDFLTLEEAARIARIGRTTAYDIAREYEATAGASGLPVVRFGKQLRVPRYRLEEWLGGPITWPIHTDDSPVATPEASISTVRSSKRSTRPANRDALPFSA